MLLINVASFKCNARKRVLQKKRIINRRAGLLESPLQRLVAFIRLSSKCTQAHRYGETIVELQLYKFTYRLNQSIITKGNLRSHLLKAVNRVHKK